MLKIVAIVTTTVWLFCTALAICVQKWICKRLMKRADKLIQEGMPCIGFNQIEFGTPSSRVVPDFRGDFLVLTQQLSWLPLCRLSNPGSLLHSIVAVFLYTTLTGVASGLNLAAAYFCCVLPYFGIALILLGWFFIWYSKGVSLIRAIPDNEEFNDMIAGWSAGDVIEMYKQLPEHNRPAFQKGEGNNR